MLDQLQKICHNSIFNNLPIAVIQDIEKFKIKNCYKKGQSIHLQGAPIFGISCIQEGIVKRVKNLDNGDETILTLAESGDFFGMDCVLSQSTSLATYSATAIENTVICFYDKDFVHSLLKNQPQFGINVITKFQEYLKEDEVRILSLAKKSVRERIAEMLIKLARQYGIRTVDEKIAIPLKLSRIELSSLAGTANETLIRTLSEFQKERMIKLIPKAIIIKDHGALSACTGAQI